jgi:hypothetical protein
MLGVWSEFRSWFMECHQTKKNDRKFWQNSGSYPLKTGTSFLSTRLFGLEGLAVLQDEVLGFATSTIYSFYRWNNVTRRYWYA